MRRFPALLLILGMAAGRVLADSASPTGADSVIYPKSMSGTAPAQGAAAGMSTTVVTLGIALGAVGLWMLWRAKKESNRVAQRGQLGIVETRSLGSKQYLVVASYGSQKFLLGVCPGKIKMLASLSEGGGHEL